MKIGTRIAIVALAACVGPAPSSTMAQPFRAVYGSNPLERIQGHDHVTFEYPGRSRVSPAYTSRYGVQELRGGSLFSSARPWDPRIHEQIGVDPRHGVSVGVYYQNPLARQWWNIPGGRLSRLSAFPAGFPGVPGAAFLSGAPARSPAAPASGTVASGGAPADTGAGPVVSAGVSHALGGVMPAGFADSLRTVDPLGQVGPALLGPPDLSRGLGTALYYPGGFGLMGPGPQRQASMLPGILGGLAGVVLGASLGGALGAIAGGVGGYLVGGFFARQAVEQPYQGFLDNIDAGYYGGPPGAPVTTATGLAAGAGLPSWISPQATSWNPYSGSAYNRDFHEMYYQRGQGRLNWLPGVAGAIMGAALGSSSGIFGLLAGGALGLLAGNVVGRVLVPQSYYDSYGIGHVFPLQDPYNDIAPFRSGQDRPRPSESTGNPASKRAGDAFAGPPKAPSGAVPGPASSTAATAPTGPAAAPGSELAAARQRFFDSLTRLQDALRTGDAAGREEAHKRFLEARDAYLELRPPGATAPAPAP